MSEIDDEVLDVKKAAELLDLGTATIYAAVAANRIPHRKIGRQIRFTRRALVRWLEAWSTQGAQEGR